MILTNSKHLIVKSNYIIEASYKLSLGEQRVIYTLTSMIKKDDVEFKPYKLSVKEFSTLLGTKSKNMYNQVSQYIESLRDKDLTIIKERSILKTKWLSSAEYFIGDGYVELCFDPKLKPYLLMLKERFTKLTLEQMVSFASQYSGRIYELLKQYEKIGSRTFKLEELRTLLAVEIDEYKKYNDFKRKIIIKAKEEINIKSDLHIDFEEVKRPRKVEAIKFIIKAKDNIKNKNIIAKNEPDKHENQLLSQVQDVFVKHPVSQYEASVLLKSSKGHIELIRKCYKYTCTKNVGNVVGYVISLLNGFYEPQENNKTIAFNNEDKRDYDFDDLEKRL
jgi:plasmid replication initiation protein